MLKDLIVVMMQRDEGQLFDAWLRHYTRLAPAENIFVLDNGSREPRTLALLTEAARTGVTVLSDFGSREDFVHKGKRIQSVIEKAGIAGRFALPCDCDEFLYARTPSGPSIAPDDLAAELALLAATGGDAFRIGEQHLNVPGAPLAYRMPCKKILLRDRAPAPLDRGFHYYNYRSKQQAYEGIKPSGLGYFHFHHRPHAAMLDASRRKLEGSITGFSPAELASHRGVGRHLVPHFGMTEETYQASIGPGRKRIVLRPIFDPIGIEPPFSR